MPAWRARVRTWLVLAAVVLILGVLLPPVGSYARQYALAESLQFVIFAVAAPALLVVGASPGLGGRLAWSRRPGVFRAAAVLAVFIALVIAWRLPVTVNALARDPYLTVAELVTLLASGSGVWLELAGSQPLLPRLSRPQRAAMAALAMWTIWVLAYIMGMSRVAWFAAYAHPAGHGLSTAADQQLAVGILWAVPALCFPPVIYAMIATWLRDSDDPDQELRKISDRGSAPAGLSSWPRPRRGWR